MSLTKPQIHALYTLYTNVINTVDDEAFDIDGNTVQYDLSALDAKVEEIAQEKENTQQTAQTKLAKLGLTPEDLKALLG